MAITITPPLGTPSVTLGLTTGGSLPAGTYYIRVVAKISGTGSYGVFKETAWQSVPSVEQTITTDATNNAITVNWAGITSANAYDVYISDTAGDYTTFNSGWVKLATAGFSGSTTNATNYTINAIPDTSGSYRGSPQHTFATGKNLPLSKELGSIKVNFDGTVTLQDIKTAIDSAGYSAYCSYDTHTFVLKGSIHITGSNAGSLTEYNKHIIFIHGSLRNQNSNVTLQFGKVSGTRYYDGCTFNMCGRCNYNFENNDKAYGCVFRWAICDTADFSFSRREELIWGPYGGGLNINNANVKQFIADNVATAFTIASSNFTCYKYSDHTVSSNAAIELSDFVYKYGYLTVRHYDGTLRDFKHEDYIRDFSMSISGAGTFKIYNADLNAVNNYPNVWWRTSQTVVIDSYATVSLKIIDQNNTAISGVAITLIDKNDAEIWSTTTDANGEASEDIKWLRSSKDPSGGNYDSVYDSVNPFTLEIRKAGYKTYKTKFTLDSKTDWTISMKRASINIDQEVLC